MQTEVKNVPKKFVYFVYFALHVAHKDSIKREHVP